MEGDGQNRLSATDDHDWGFVCKVCGRFFADKEIEHWATRWEERSGESWLVEIDCECPHCGQNKAYHPNEGTVRALQKSGQNG